MMVAKPHLEAFKSILTDTSGGEITLYGRGRVRCPIEVPVLPAGETKRDNQC